MIFIIFFLKNDTELEAESPSKPKERPIASRRTYVSSKGGAESSENNEQLGDSPSLAINDSFENITTDSSKVEENSTEVVASEAANNNSSSSSNETKEGGESSKVEFTPKAVKEIEKEIAENTAKFDAQTLQKEDPNKKKSKGKSAAGKLKIGVPNNIQPASVLKFLRVAVLLIVGIHIGTFVCICYMYVNLQFSPTKCIYVFMYVQLLYMYYPRIKVDGNL